MNDTDLNPADLAKYSAAEVANLADLDMHAVRNEGERRQEAAMKKLASLKRQIVKAEAELAGAAIIILAAQKEARK